MNINLNEGEEHMLRSVEGEQRKESVYCSCVPQEI